MFSKQAEKSLLFVYIISYIVRPAKEYSCSIWLDFTGIIGYNIIGKSCSRIMQRFVHSKKWLKHRNVLQYSKIL